MRTKRPPLVFVLLTIFMLLSLAACGGEEAAPAQEEAAAAEEAVDVEAGDCGYTGSPMLSEKVAAGDLPGVCDRLPKDPLVFTHDLIVPDGLVEAEVGTHGGTLVSTIGEVAIYQEPMFYSINRTPIDTASMVFADFHMSADYTEMTFTIREGLKWSDGVPVTTEDVEFRWNDVLNNIDVTPTFPSWLKTGGSGAGGIPTLAVVDDYTFKLTYDGPYPGITKYLNGNWQWIHYLIEPKHYLKQFHEKYADADTLAGAVEEAGFDEWYELYDLKNADDWNGVAQEAAIGLPRLNPWILVDFAEDRYVIERNPYYGLVDSAGNQLPYFDRINVVPVSFTAPETAELMMFSGEGHYNWNLDLTKLPLYKQEEAKGLMWAIPYPNKDSRALYLNLSYDDPTWRSVVQDLRFRQALGLAMDCETINKEIYLETAAIPVVTHGCEYDPDAANALLDEMDMTERDGDGFRLAPNGEPFEIPMTLMAWDIGYNSQAPFLADQFMAVGLNTTYKMVEGNIFWDQLNANGTQATIIWSFSPVFESDVQWPSFQPTTKNAPLWYEWASSGGELGEEPPDWIKESLEINDAMAGVLYGSDAYKALEARRDEWVRNNIPYLDFVEQPGIVHMFNNCLGNVANGPLYHHGSWTQHRLIFFKPGCDPSNP